MSLIFMRCDKSSSLQMVENFKITLKDALSLPSGSVGQKTWVSLKHSSQPSSRISWMRRKVSLQASTCRKRWQVIPQRNLRNDASKMTSCYILLMFVDLRGTAMCWSRYVKLCQNDNPTPFMVRWSGPKSFAGISKTLPQILIETKHLCILRSELLDVENPFVRNSESSRSVLRR